MFTWLSRLGALKLPRQPEFGSSDSAGRAALLPEPVGPDLEPGLAIDGEVGILGGESEQVPPAGLLFPELLRRLLGDAVDGLQPEREQAVGPVGGEHRADRAVERRHPRGRREPRRPPIQGARSAAGCWSASGG